MNKSHSNLQRSIRLRSDMTPDDNDRIEIGPGQLAFEEWAKLDVIAPDMPALREYRLARVREQLHERDFAGILLFDPLNLRYATDSTNMQLWIAHNQARACFIATEGPLVMFDFHNCQHLSKHLPLITEVRKMTPFFYFSAGDRCAEFAELFAAEIDDLVRLYGGGNRRLAVDKMEIHGVRALDRLKIEIADGMALMESAREIKNENEIRAMRCAVISCEAAIQEMATALKPGISENELWAYLHFGNIKRGGEWIETRLLSSGQRTNPWMAECGPRIIQPGEVVAFDTDLIGAYGYCVDLSRTWLAGDGHPTSDQKRLYQTAYQHLQKNTLLLKPGLSARELTFGGHLLEDRYKELQYSVKYHGVGMCDEFPSIVYPENWTSNAFEDVLAPGMVLCVEAYVGETGGKEGIKLEEQVLITEDGHEVLTKCPFEQRFLA